MKRFKNLFEADAADYKKKEDDDEEVLGYKPRSKEEEDLLNLHKGDKMDHPTAPDEQFSGDRPKGKKGKTGMDSKGPSEKGQELSMTFKQFMKLGGNIGNAKYLGMNAGEKAPVMQGSSKVSEEVELEEALRIPRRGGLTRKTAKTGKYVIKATGKNMGSFARLADVNFQTLGFDFNHSPEKLEKGITQKDDEMEVSIKLNVADKGPAKDIDGNTRYKDAVITVKKLKEEVEYIDEAFKKGMLTLKDGKSVKVDEATAKMLNNAMKQLNPGNRKKMETEAMKDKKSFDAMVTFAKAAA